MINFRYPPYGEAMIELSSDELYELEHLFNESPTLFRSFSYAWGLGTFRTLHRIYIVPISNPKSPPARSSSPGDLHKALGIFEGLCALLTPEIYSHRAGTAQTFPQNRTHHSE